MMLAVGERYRSILEESLIFQGFEILWLPDNPLRDLRLAGHADLSIFRAGRDIIVSRGIHPQIVNLLTNRGYNVGNPSDDEGDVYPLDAGLCVCDTGKYLISNPKTTDAAVRTLMSDRIEIPVKQGYTACSVCVADERSIITSDNGVAVAAAMAGLDVLKISEGCIELPGFDHGFIGGASVRLNETTLGFVGELSHHPDGTEIKAFLARKGQKVLELKKGALLDIGSGISLPQIRHNINYAEFLVNLPMDKPALLCYHLPV